MPNPTRDSGAGRIYNDLRNLAKRTSRSTDALMLEYVLERFLYRLSVNPQGQEHFVLKGGLLLAQFGARRMTRDIDILGRGFPANEAEIIRRIGEIAATACDDGVEFQPDTLATVPIRQDDQYHGLRLSMVATISRARLKLQLDVSFGDPITPATVPIDYPQYLADEPFRLLGYPISTVIAEKLSTAVALGDLNTRDRDWADLYQLVTRHRLDGGEVAAAIRATADHRGIALRLLSTVIWDLPTSRQAPYTAWLRRQGPSAGGHPQSFGDIVATVSGFADPLLAGSASGRTWDPTLQLWT
jgi:hypothetical protein